MPSNVTWFERLSYALLAVGLVNIYLDGPRMLAKPELQGIGIGGMVFAWFVFAAILILFIWLAARRRKNWARIVLLVMFLGGLPLSVPHYAELMRENISAAIVSSLQLLMQAAAMFLIFTGNARDWFRKDTKVA